MIVINVKGQNIGYKEEKGALTAELRVQKEQTKNLNIQSTLWLSSAVKVD